MVSFSAGTISVLLLRLATASGCHFRVLPLLCFREHVSWKGASTSIWVLDFGGCRPGDTPWPPGSGCQGSWGTAGSHGTVTIREFLAGFHSQDTTQSEGWSTVFLWGRPVGFLTYGAGFRFDTGLGSYRTTLKQHRLVDISFGCRLMYIMCSSSVSLQFTSNS